MQDEVEEYLKSVVIPEHESHRQELRRKILDEMKKRRRTASKKKPFRIVCVLAALVCISALAIAGATYRKWRFKGKENGAYVFTKEPEKIQRDGKEIWRGSSFMITSKDPNFTMSLSEIEQTRKDLEEIDVLRQQDKRELMKVIQTEVEGEIGRTYIYKYVLADGREKTIGKGDPRSEKVRSVDPREVWELRIAGKGQLLDPEEEEVKGKVFVFERYKITLKDGREVIHSIGVPKEE